MNIKSKRGEEVRNKIMDFLKQNEVRISPVSIREISDDLGGVSTSVIDYHLDVLEKEGKIERSKATARSIKVVK